MNIFNILPVGWAYIPKRKSRTFPEFTLQVSRHGGPTQKRALGSFDEVPEDFRAALGNTVLCEMGYAPDWLRLEETEDFWTMPVSRIEVPEQDKIPDPYDEQDKSPRLWVTRTTSSRVVWLPKNQKWLKTTSLTKAWFDHLSDLSRRKDGGVLLFDERGVDITIDPPAIPYPYNQPVNPGLYWSYPI